MKTQNDFKRALGSADPDFVACINQTLTKLQINEEEKPMKKISTSFILVMVLLSIATMAFAAASQWGIFEFIQDRGNENAILPEASELIQYDSSQQVGQTDSASFSLREAIFDGQQLYMVIAVKPTDPNTLLLGCDNLPSDGVSNMGPDYKDLPMAIMDYAYKNNKTTLLHTNVYDAAIRVGEAGFFESAQSILEEDGTLVYMLQGPYTSEQKTLEVNLLCQVIPYVDITENDVLDTDKTQVTELSFVLETAEVRNVVVSEEATIFEDCGVRIDQITLTGTAMSTHIEVEFTVVDEAAYALTDDGLWFEFLDEKGEPISPGFGGNGSISEVEGTEANERKFSQKGTFVAMEKLPDTLTVRGFNCWEKNRYETHEFDLK